MLTLAIIRPFGHNVGNHAINFALRQMLYTAFGRLVSVIEYPATGKHGGGAKAGLTAPTVHEINRFADGVLVGGGNLYENGEIDIDPQALTALQPPLMLFSISRGRIYDRAGKLSERSDVISDALLSALLERADLSLSRDSATHEHLRRINPKDELGWCPTINISRYANLIPSLPGGENAGALIAVRTPSLVNVPYYYQSRIQSQIDLAIDSLRSRGFPRVRILCNDSRDLDFATAFRYTKGVDSVFTSDVYQYLALLKGADIVISYRLHASLPAISMGVPTVNIVYDERAWSLFDDLGLKGHYINLLEAGDRMDTDLTRLIQSGGFVPRSALGIEERWAGISCRQMVRFAEFRDLVVKYVEEVRGVMKRPLEPEKFEAGKRHVSK